MLSASASRLGAFLCFCLAVVTIGAAFLGPRAASLCFQATRGRTSGFSRAMFPERGKDAAESFGWNSFAFLHVLENTVRLSAADR